jgi:hypothetical protein
LLEAETFLQHLSLYREGIAVLAVNPVTAYEVLVAVSKYHLDIHHILLLLHYL